MKVIELCGFPGSGKTYALNNVNKNSINIITTEEMYKKIYNFSNKNQKTIEFIIKNFYLVMCLLVYSIKYCGLKSILRFFQLIRYFVIYDYILESNRFSEEIVLDQGIIQFIWSLSSQNVNYGVRKSKLLSGIINKIINRYNLYIIYYKTDINLAAERASVRNSDCPIDKLEYIDICRLYKIHQSDFDILLNYINNERKYIVENIDDLNTELFNILS